MSQPLHIQFRGLEEGTDPKTQPVGALLAALNCRMDKARRLHKRWGTAGYATDIVGGGAISAGSRLVELSDGNVGLIDGTNLYAWVDDPEQWKLVDRVCPLRVTRRPHIDNAASVAAMDFAVSSGLLISVWSLPDTTYGVGTSDVPVFFQVVDTATQDIVYPPTQLTSAGRAPRVVILGGKAVFLWTNSSGDLAYRDLTLSTLALGSAGTLDTGMAVGGGLDAHVAGSTLYVVYKLAAGANRTRIRGFSTAYAATISPADFGSTGQGSYSLHVTSGESAYLLAADGSGNVLLYTMSPTTLAISTGPTTILAAAGAMTADAAFVTRESSTTCLVGCDEQETINGLTVRRATTMVVNGSTHAITANTTRRTNHAQWMSEPFQVSSRWYAVAQVVVGFTTAGIEPSSDVLLEIRTSAYSAAVAPHAHVGTLENQTAGQSGGGTMYATPTDGSGVTWVASQFRREEREDQFAPVGVNMNRVTTGGDIFRPLKNGRVTMLIGAAPFVADGLTTAPYGFIHGPRIGTITWSGAGGAVTAGAYQYAGYYARHGPDGVLQRSQVAKIASTTAGATDTGTIPFVTSCVDAKLSEQTGFSSTASPVRILAHRTEDSQTVLYMLTFEPTHNVVTSSPTTGVVTLTDTRADSDVTGGSTTTAPLSARPTLYTDTELDDLPPPASTTGTVHRNRFWLISSEETTVWASKDGSEDLSIAPGFNETLTLQFATPKRALASLDDKLVAFGDDDIDIVHGDGPDSNGDSNTWQIARLQTDVGCVNPRSVVVTPFGVIFESRRGLEMLDRGLNVSPVGQAIEDQLASFPTITSAVLVAEEGEVRFTANNTAGTSGIVIVWDYINKFWHTRKYRDSLGTDNTSTPFVDAALIGGVYHMLTSAGLVYREDKDTFLDGGGDWVERDAYLAWISPAGPSAWHRFRRWQVLGTNVGNHDLKLSVARDYATSWEQDSTFAAQTTPTTIGPIQQARISPKYQKATAQRLRLQDITPTTGSVGTGAGPIWEAVTLEFDVLSKTARTSAAEQA